MFCFLTSEEDFVKKLKHRFNFNIILVTNTVAKSFFVCVPFRTENGWLRLSVNTKPTD